MVAHWAAANGCQPVPDTDTLPETLHDGGHLIRLSTYRDCRPRGDVVLLAVEGGGHSWPDGSRFKASEAIWAFFATHPRNADELEKTEWSHRP